VSGTFSDTVFFAQNFYLVSGCSSVSIPQGYFAKYDQNGNFLWAKKIVGERQIAEPKIRVNANNHVYVMGGFDMRSSTDSVDFDPGPGEAMLISKGSLDIFLAKYDSAGNYIWAKSFGGTQQDR